MSTQLRVPHRKFQGAKPTAQTRLQNGAPQGAPQNNTHRPAQQLEALKQRRRRFEENRLFVVNGQMLRFSPDLAREIGDRESQLLLQYEYWIATEGITLPDGRRCLQDSLRALHDFFNWWTYSMVQRTFDSVVAQGYLYTEPVPDHRCKSGTNKNAGRLVFVHHRNCARLQSIQVNSRNYLLDPPTDSPTDPPLDYPLDYPSDSSSDSSLPAENGVSTTPVCGVSEVYHFDTPASEVYQNRDEVYQKQAKVYHSDTPPIYKDCARERVKEYKKSSTEERAGAPRGAPEATPLPITLNNSQVAKGQSDGQTDDERRNFSNLENGGANLHSAENSPSQGSITQGLPTQGLPTQHLQIEGLQVDDWGNISCDDDVRGLLYAFAISAQNIRHIEAKDWDAIPDAIRFMRRENLSIEEIEQYVSRSRQRFRVAYLSQFVKRFYQNMPHLASRQNAALRASQKSSQQAEQQQNQRQSQVQGLQNSPSPAPPNAPLTAPSHIPVRQESLPQNREIKSALESESDQQRRVLAACHAVFLTLPDGDAANLRTEAETMLPPMLQDRLRAARKNNREPGYGELRTIQETMFALLWQNYREQCQTQINAQSRDITQVPLVHVSAATLRYPPQPDMTQAEASPAGEAALPETNQSANQPENLLQNQPGNNQTVESSAPPSHHPAPKLSSTANNGFAGAAEVIGGVLRQMQNGGVPDQRKFA